MDEGTFSKQLNRQESISSPIEKELFENLKKLHSTLDQAFLRQFDRSLPLNETLLDRWERAKNLGFGENSSIYDSSLILGKVEVGKNCWIGPFTILDGSGGLKIGDFCTVSAGVHIYSHDNVKQTLSSGKLPIEREAVSIGSNVYIAPQVVIAKGVSIGNFCVIGTGAFVNKNIKDCQIVVGQPAKVIGEVIVSDSRIDFKYF
ncbi:acetyltransferase-like isoleucine patch superfamily enzyme [Algoriphagus aquaeductus]|uniref:Acetyltransferase-like isoleucine patch superfamily enzyme n=1 Tax=Algoriphagus aquaeductus TaxID=475299 RepID=A0A326RM88_9BACT|nr:acetyltransferase-like isoleucine patch superfamily enzyme [Algoriphagus aquaeductus]